MATINLLYEKEYPINDSIKIVIPTVEQVLKNEDGYYSVVSSLTSMPIDMMVSLDDAGIDFTTINAYELFLILFNGIKSQDTSLVFGSLDLTKFEIYIDNQSGAAVLYDSENDIKIDRAVYEKISSVMRMIHHIEKNNRKAGNDEAKKYLIERERKKLNRRKKASQKSQIETLIVAMVNTEQFKYNYDSVKQLSIYQFNESVQQIVSKVDYEHKMHGVYAGTINVKDLSQDDFNWLEHK